MVGVQGRVAENENQAQSALSDAIGRNDVGIIIVTESAAELVRHEIEGYMFTRDFPLIVEVPNRKGKLAGKAGIRDMVNSAIGINL